MAGQKVPNEDQAGEWDGDQGKQWVDHQERYDRILAPFTGRLLDATGGGPGASVLDVGCGCGATTRAVGLAARQALGVDLSGPMVERARELAAGDGLGNVRFEKGDVQVHPFEPARFDVAMSRFGVMFFDDPVAAFTNVAGALRDGGRLVFTCWRPVAENEWIMAAAGALLDHVPVPDLGEEGQPGPFSLADPDRVRALLDAAGFESISIEPLDVPLHLGMDAADTAGFLEETEFGKQLLRTVPDDVAERAMAAVREKLTGYETAEGVVLGSAAWLVSARLPDSATRPGS